MKKRKIRSILFACGVVIVVGLLVLLPFLMEANADRKDSEVSILRALAERSTLTTALSGTGTLTEQERLSVSVPDGVKLREYLVEDGETVEVGTALASVDTLSVMNAITQVQDTLDTLKEQIDDAADKEAETEITAKVGGRVMKVYCAEGDDVRTVMLAHGALALVSLDGKLMVGFETDAAVSTGEDVTVLLSDGTELAGRVESALSGAVSVTVSDELAPYGGAVTVKRGSETLGSGTLEIHNPWRAAAYTGTVKSVKVSEGDEISDGRTVCTLEDTEDTSEFELLTAKHRVYEEILTELFVLYQEKTVKAARDGVVCLPEDTEPYLLAASGGECRLMLLANAPNGDDETMYVNFVGVVTEASEAGLSMNMQAMPVQVEDYAAFAAQGIPQEQMTEPKLLPATGAPVFFRTGEQWQQGSLGDIRSGDILLFAYTMDSAEPVWIVKLASSAQPEDPGENPDDNPDDNPGEKPDDNPGEKPGEDQPGQNPTQKPDGGGTNPWGDFQIPSGYESYFSGMQGMQGLQQGQFSQSALYAQYGGTPMEEAVVTLYSEVETEIMTIIPQDEVTLDISVDELDVRQVALGQSAEVTLDALPGRAYHAEVTAINTQGVNAGGSTKYTVTLTMPREENMLDGMNAAVRLPMEQHDNVLTIPVAALCEQGTGTVVYRAYDEEHGLTEPVEVTTGVSDGENVEILSGLSEGDTVWYEYYDKLQISNAVESRYPGFR